MRFLRAAYADDLLRLRGDRRPAVRALGDNYQFEENVGDLRREDFEAFSPGTRRLKPAVSDYFFGSVQGELRTHIPSTFRPENADALLGDTIERIQKVLRLERIDDALGKNDISFTELHKAVTPRTRDHAVVAPLVRALNSYAGARPAFACFKAEMETDLREPDWLRRMMTRLGLGHWAFAPGEEAHFALMEYTVEDVFRDAPAPVRQPFAIPTVLDVRNSEFFFPAPKDAGFGYTVDLDDAASRDPIREVLHVRIEYEVNHVVRAEKFVGPTPATNLAEVRDRHLLQLRMACNREDYGAIMAPEVDR